MTPAEIQALNAQTLWTPQQRNHLRRLIRAGATIAYVVTDRHGLPSNGGAPTLENQLYPGKIQEVCRPLFICTPNALHGTFEPHRWCGERVWVAGFLGEIQEGADKIGALRRETVGEVFPKTALSASVGVRLGRADLAGADLRYARLEGADLHGADLRGVNLWGACLQRANLQLADLRGADLRYASFQWANTRGADLTDALTSPGWKVVGGELQFDGE